MSLDRPTVETTLKTHERFSGVVSVRSNGAAGFAAGYGYAGRADRLPCTINTRFGIASGTKLLTGVAICQLVEQGRLTFDTRLKDVIQADFPLFDPAVTVHHLLTHTAGVPDYFDESVMADFGALWLKYPSYTMRTPRDFLPMFQHSAMKFAPGERFSYNNGGFVLLGLIIEAVSGQAYTDYVTEHVLQKAGMTDSGFFPLNQLPPNTASSYIDHDDGTWHTNIFEVPVIGGADGGVFVTAPDMGRFWDALFAHRLLNAAMTARFLHPHVADIPEEGAACSYGYGIWMIRHGDSILRYYGVGSDPGVSFASTWFPRTQTELTVISNTGDGAWAVFEDLLALV